MAPSTRANYRMNLDRHILPLLGRHQVSEIRPRLVASFLVHLADKGLAPGTVRKVRTVLSAIMSYAVAMEYVESNPVMKVPPPELDGEERVAPTLEETAALMLAAERHDPDFLTYLWEAAEEGGRRGETLALRWGCVDFDTGVLTIDATITRGDDGVKLRHRTKTKKPRRVAVSSHTLALLADLKRRTEGRLSFAAGAMARLGPDDFVFSGGVATRSTGSRGTRARRRVGFGASRNWLGCGLRSTSTACATR